MFAELRDGLWSYDAENVHSCSLVSVCGIYGHLFEDWHERMDVDAHHYLSLGLDYGQHISGNLIGWVCL